MSRLSYDQYGLRAKLFTDPFMATMRLPKDRHKVPFTLDDITQKLQLEYADRLLDIGCGIGDLTIPLSFRVSDVLGIDHPDCVERLKRRLPEDRIRVLAGDWLTIELKEAFSKILVYDAIHYLATVEEVERFIFKAAALLEVHGRMLVGDIPSANLRSRFDETQSGRSYNRNWNQQMIETNKSIQINRNPTEEELEQIRTRDLDTVKLDDAALIGLMTKLRAAGYQAWLIPQPSELPFQVQREDLLITRP